MQSEKVDLIVKALIKAKSQIEPVEKNKVNPFFGSKYSTLDAVEAAVRSPLSLNGLAITQTTAVVAGQAVLETTLWHESGQWISGQYPLNPTKNDPQGLGSAMTYARRYTLSAILGLVSDEDDDGAAASVAHQTKVHKETAAAPTQRAAPANGGKVITDAQGRRLYALWKNAHRQDDEVKAWIKAKYGFATTRDITSDKYEEICTVLSSNESLELDTAEVPF